MEIAGEPDRPVRGRNLLRYPDQGRGVGDHHAHLPKGGTWGNRLHHRRAHVLGWRRRAVLVRVSPRRWLGRLVMPTPLRSMRLVALLASITALLAGCATPAHMRLSSGQILELAKKELIACCGIEGPGYDIAVSEDEEGWYVSAMPVHPSHAPPKREGGEAASIHDVEGTTVLVAGGDVQLVYDPN